MAKAKKINLSDIIKGTETKTVMFGDAEVLVKERLSMQDLLSLVRNVVGSVVDTDSGFISYEAKEFFTRKAILEFYTNINIPDDIEKSYILTINEDIMNLVLANINKWQYDVIMKSINENISLEKEKICSNYAFGTQTFISDINNEINKLLNPVEKFMSAFEDINPEQIKPLADKIIKMEDIDELKLAKAVLETQTVK